MIAYEVIFMLTSASTVIKGIEQFSITIIENIIIIAMNLILCSHDLLFTTYKGRMIVN